jgi:hypothetical protein
VTAASIRRRARRYREEIFPIAIPPGSARRQYNEERSAREMREEVRSSSGAAAEPAIAIARSSSSPHTPVARYGSRPHGTLLLWPLIHSFGADAWSWNRSRGARIGGYVFDSA